MMVERVDNGEQADKPANGDGPEICVTIDAYGISRASLEAAVTVAEQSKVGLLGLFMEDMLLQSVAELPFTTEVVRSTGEERELFAEGVRLRRQQLLSQVRSLFDECVVARQVRFRFEVSERRVPVTALLERMSGIYVPGRPRNGLSRRLGSATVQRVKLLYDGSEQAKRGVELVISLVGAGHCREVLVASFCSLPASLLTKLSAQGARVYLLNEQKDQQRVLRQIVDGPAADLVLVPFPLVSAVDPLVLQGSLRNSPSQGTLLISR